MRVERLLYKWMVFNELGDDIPDDAYLHVDTENRIITVEKFFRDADGTQCIHGGNGIFTTYKKFPLLVDIDPDLYQAYQQWRFNLKASRSAKEAILHEYRIEIFEKLSAEGFPKAAERVLQNFPFKRTTETVR